MSDELWQTLQGVWPPLVVVVPLLWIARRPWSGGRHAPGGAWSVSLGIGFGFLAAYCVLKSSPWPPHGANDWHALLVATTAVLGVCTFLRTGPWTAAALALLAASPLLMFSRLWDGWDGLEALAQLSGSAALLVILGAGLVPLGRGSRGAALPLALALATAVGGYVLFAGHSASLGQLSGALAAGFGACTAMALWHRGLSVGAGGALVGALGLGGLVLLGHHLAYQPPPLLPRLCLLAAPLCAWIERLEPVRKRGEPVRVIVVGAAVALPLTVAVWLVQDELDDGY